MLVGCEGALCQVTKYKVCRVRSISSYSCRGMGNTGGHGDTERGSSVVQTSGFGWAETNGPAMDDKGDDKINREGRRKRRTRRRAKFMDGVTEAKRKISARESD